MHGKTWHYLDTGASEAAFNMAVDEVLLGKMGAPGACPILRFYTWSRPAITIGYFQGVQDVFDLEAIEANGWSFVRRLTGGRAVFHNDELTYSVLLPHDAPQAAGDVLESYKSLSRGLMAGLRNLGVEAELVSPPRKGMGRRGSAARSANCFASSSWYEIQVGGRKLVGSAQRRMSQGILQQGSILVSTGQFDKFFQVLLRRGQGSTGLSKGGEGARMTSLMDVTKRPVDLAGAKRAILKGFAETYQIRFETVNLSDADEMAAGELVRDRYGRKDWNLLRKSHSLKRKNTK